MTIGDRLARLVWWRILKGMRRPRIRLLKTFQTLPPEERQTRMASFSKNEKFARRIGPKLLSLTFNGFFLLLTVGILYTAAQFATVFGLIPDLPELAKTFNAPR